GAAQELVGAGALATACDRGYRSGAVRGDVPFQIFILVAGVTGRESGFRSCKVRRSSGGCPQELARESIPSDFSCGGWSDVRTGQSMGNRIVELACSATMRDELRIGPGHTIIEVF